MTKARAAQLRWPLRILAFCALLLPLLTGSTAAVAGTAAADDFNRADGSLGASWTDIGDGGLSISSQAVTGSGGLTGDIRTAEAYGSDQYSQVEVTATQLGGGQWIGPAVRVSDGGQDAYAGIYFWDSGSPELMLFKRVSGSWTQLGSAYAAGPLAAGTRLRLTAAGTTISLQEDGTTRISADDGTVAGGAPGIMAYGAARADNWQGADIAGTYSVGGTASGISGTVVLQDNGGDSLSVSGDGAFTFGTLLADGADYSVTVRSHPAGLACTVSGGSGTVSGASVTGIAVSCAASSASSAADDFNRADGGLGASWTDIGDGGLSIASGVAAGASGVTGDIRTAEAYASDQYSQLEVTATQLASGQWIGPAVRVSDGGQDAYAGIYNWNGGDPELMLFRRSAGNWSQLGSTYDCGPLAAGTQLRVMVVGSTISFLENGVERIAVYDSGVSGGAPAIMAFGAATADNWSGGPAGFEVHYLSTDSDGVASYDMISASDGYGPQVLRVLRPTHPAPGVPHSFLYVLPVEPGLGTGFGDGLKTLRALDAQDQYNLTIIEPSFGIDPWYADNPGDANVQYETFMAAELQPWVTQHLAVSGSEQNWLIGFSKSGIGAQDLILKHPGLFTLAASWDFPADMSAYDQYGSSSANSYGTDANFQAGYRLTPAFLTARKAPFLASNRIWIGGYSAFPTDDSDYDRLLSTEGIEHTTEAPQAMAHRWDGGWVPIALAALYQDSISLPPG